MKVGILSYYDYLRTYAHCNHEVYAVRNGYTYIFDIAPTLHGVYLTKIDKLLKFLDFFDWIFWIDDDAFFTNFDQKLEPFIALHPDADIIFCKSPRNETGGWTYISAGNFFIRNTPASRAFLEAVPNVDMNKVKRWWDESKYGIFTNGDQDAIVYLLEGPEKPAIKCVRLEYTHFNTRPFHFTDRLDEHLLVHFTGGSKREQAQAFGRRFGLDEDIVPHAVRDAYMHSAKHKQEK